MFDIFCDNFHRIQRGPHSSGDSLYKCSSPAGTKSRPGKPGTNYCIEWRNKSKHDWFSTGNDRFSTRPDRFSTGSRFFSIWWQFWKNRWICDTRFRRVKPCFVYTQPLILFSMFLEFIYILVLQLFYFCYLMFELGSEVFQLYFFVQSWKLSSKKLYNTC